MNISGWGRYPVIKADARGFDSVEAVRQRIQGGQDCIVHALGRSYGDSALNDRVLLTRRLRSILAFDPKTGVLRCEAGVSLAEIMDAFLPRGWFLAVTPGTKYVTVGGAIASDVHGKNHHSAGCFSACVRSMDVMTADGRVVACSANRNKELFQATAGGMGLTGVILAASIQLKRVHSASINQRVLKARNLEETFALFEEYRPWTYSVAWIDCLARGDRLGRSLLMVGEHADDGRMHPPAKRVLGLPMDMPACLLNRYTVSLFNALYYGKQLRRASDSLVPLTAFFYPLDAMLDWNRLYGKRGFTQYQFVLPKAASLQGLRTILGRISARGFGSFLAVLKLLGEENANHLSFPMEGYTLALDFKIEPRLFPFLDELDRIVVDLGGRIYLTKDVRMPRAVFEKTYPRLERFRSLRRKLGLDEVFRSLQSKRLGL